MSRTDARSNKLRRRPARTTPASIVSVVVLAVGVGLVWITVLRLLNGRWPRFLGAVHEWLATLTWGSTITVAISLAAVAVGLILLFCAWKPGQPNAIVLHVDRTGDVDGSGDVAGSTEFVMTRRSVAWSTALIRSRRLSDRAGSPCRSSPSRRSAASSPIWSPTGSVKPSRVWGCNRCRRSPLPSTPSGCDHP